MVRTGLLNIRKDLIMRKNVWIYLKDENYNSVAEILNKSGYYWENIYASTKEVDIVMDVYTKAGIKSFDKICKLLNSIDTINIELVEHDKEDNMTVLKTKN